MTQYAPFLNVIGRVIREPQVKTVGDSEVVNFGIARRTGFKSEGEQYDPSEFYDVDVWDGDKPNQKRLFAAALAVRKGQFVGVESSAPKVRESGGKKYSSIRPWNMWRAVDIEAADSDDGDDI